MKKIILSCLLLSLFACAATTEDCVVEQCRADSLSEEWCQAKIPQICHASEDFSRPEHDITAPMNKIPCDKHTWPRLNHSEIIQAAGRRTITTCNNCLATKVMIETEQPDGSIDKVETIVEPIACKDS